MDEKQKDKITDKLDNNADSSAWPKEDLVIQGDTFWYVFNKDNCKNTNWGYKFTVYA